MVTTYIILDQDGHERTNMYSKEDLEELNRMRHFPKDVAKWNKDISNFCEQFDKNLKIFLEFNKQYKLVDGKLVYIENKEYI